MGYEFVTSSDLTRDNDNSTLFFRKKVSPITYMTSQCTNKGQEIYLFTVSYLMLLVMLWMLEKGEGSSTGLALGSKNRLRRFRSVDLDDNCFSMGGASINLWN